MNSLEVIKSGNPVKTAQLSVLGAASFQGR